MADHVPEIVLYEMSPTRSARCRWTLLEAGLPFESRGNAVEIFGSDELLQYQPLGKLPVALIDGRPLFESAAICTAIADLVPEMGLIAPSGAWARALHDQWVSFALTELEAWVWCAELNMLDFVLPEAEHVKAIVPQNEGLFRKSAAVLDAALTDADWLVENRFSVTDIIVGYTVDFGAEFGWIDDRPAPQAYLRRLHERPHCTLQVRP